MTDKVSIDALNAHLAVDGWSAMRSLTADEVNSVVRELLAHRTAANPLQAVLDKFPGVKVKPLEFKGPGDEQVYYGEQGGFVYTVRPPSRTPGWRVWVALTAKDSIQAMVGGLIVTMKAETREAAFAAAQADYERRSLSTLESTPAPVSDSIKEVLLPCPFCGGGSVSVHGPRGALGAWVACTSCGLETPTETGVTAEQAFAYWNRRAPALTAAMGGK